MTQFYDAIYLSAHLDDVPLSCGGQIYQRTQAGQRVLIVTVLAGDAPANSLSAFAQYQHDNWQAGHNPPAQRRVEEEAACQILGAEWQHWTLQDCIYRTNPATGEALYSSDDGIFGAVHSAETPLIAQIAKLCQNLPAHGEIFAPLARGNHVDHQLVRAAAERAFGNELVYYEDYPYVQRENFTGLDADWEGMLVGVSAESLQKRIDAIAAHQSQLGMLFGGYEAMQQAVTDYTNQISGERLWRKKQN